MMKIGESLALAALMIGVSLGLGAAQNAGLISNDVVIRAVMVMTMLVFAYYANLVPKAISSDAHQRAARRFAGWALTSSGLASAGLWIFAPIDVAVAASIALVGAAVVVVLSRGGTATS
jgi:hypothetical protein